MAWSDVAGKVKFCGSTDDGLEGEPSTVNGILAYGGAFSVSEKNEILEALQQLYDHSPTASALLNAGAFRYLVAQIHQRFGIAILPKHTFSDRCLPAPVVAKASPMPTHERLGPDDCEHLQDGGKPAIQLDQEPTIMVRQPDATMQPSLETSN
jgi:hypothetical protein